MVHVYDADILVRQQKAAVERQAREYSRHHPFVDPPEVKAPTGEVSRWRRGLRLVLAHG